MSGVYTAPYGDDQKLAQDIAKLQDQARRFASVFPAGPGWGSEQVWNFTQSVGPYYYRGFILKHRNAVAWVDIYGPRDFATWDHASSLLSIVEKRLWDALKS